MNELTYKSEPSVLSLAPERWMIWLWQSRPDLFHKAAWSIRVSPGRRKLVFTTFCLN